MPKQWIVRFGRTAAIAVILVAMAAPAQAFAQAPTASQYSDSDISAIGDPGDPVDPGSHATGGSLPFSGSELIYAALVGTGLVGLGLGMHRLTRAPSTS